MHVLTTFERRRIDEHRLCGWVITTSDAFTLLARWNEFVFDGFQITRNRDVTKQYVSDSDRYCSRLTRAEGSWVGKLPRGLRALDLTSWSSIFSGIKAEVVIVENERNDARFLIGPVVDTSRTAVTIHHFDSVGEWQDPVVMPFSRITTCRFMDRYSATHAKYLTWDDEPPTP